MVDLSVDRGCDKERIRLDVKSIMVEPTGKVSMKSERIPTIPSKLIPLVATRAAAALEHPRKLRDALGDSSRCVRAYVDDLGNLLKEHL